MKSPRENPDAEAKKEENRRIRTFRFLSDLTLQRLCVERMTLSEARTMVRELKGVAARFFPGKDHVFDLVVRPRLERVISERFTAVSGPADRMDLSLN